MVNHNRNQIKSVADFIFIRQMIVIIWFDSEGMPFIVTVYGTLKLENRN